MNRLSTEIRAQALHMLVEGSSMSSIARVIGIDINTVSKLLIDAGNACQEFHDEVVRDVQASHIQCDEMWSFCYAKERNAPYATGVIDSAGNVWTWVGIERYSKLVVSWLAGGRDTRFAYEFMFDLQSRLANRIQLSTDGYRPYLDAVDAAFGGRVDYGQLVKYYHDGTTGRFGRYRTKERVTISGLPNPEEITTNHVERHNLTIRMSVKRFTRKTNAFSKKFENHGHALALYFVWYNFCRYHRTLGTTPAVASGLAEYKYDMRWIVELINERTPAPVRGPYRKRR